MMKFITHPLLPRPLPAIALGTMHFSPATADADFRLMDAYIAAGGDALDTAHVYGAGQSESCIGKWLKERQNRAKITVITKGCHPKGDGKPRVTPAAIHTDLSESLSRLETDSADIWLFHRDDPAVPVGELVSALNEEMKEGRIRAFGASNWTVRRIAEANAWAKSHEMTGFCLSSVNLALVEPSRQVWDGCLSADGETREWHRKSGFPLLAWSPQARGFFNDRYAGGTPFNEELKSLYGHQAAQSRLERARAMAKQRGLTANRVALAWVLAQPFPVSAVAGPRGPEQLADSLSALDSALSDEEVSLLENG